MAPRYFPQNHLPRWRLERLKFVDSWKTATRSKRLVNNWALKYLFTDEIEWFSWRKNYSWQNTAFLWVANESHGTLVAGLKFWNSEPELPRQSCKLFRLPGDGPWPTAPFIFGRTSSPKGAYQHWGREAIHAAVFWERVGILRFQLRGPKIFSTFLKTHHADKWFFRSKHGDVTLGVSTPNDDQWRFDSWPLDTALYQVVSAQAQTCEAKNSTLVAVHIVQVNWFLTKFKSKSALSNQSHTWFS